MFRRRAVQRTRAGGFRLRLSSAERELLRGLAEELRALLDERPDDPALRRLFPPAYEEDGEAEAEYRRLLGESLADGQRKALETVERTLARSELTEAELDAWLRALNGLRLALGTRLDVREDTFARDLDPRDPEARELAAYAYLTWLEEQVVVALSP
jgi:hypothetical protein